MSAPPAALPPGPLKVAPGLRMKHLNKRGTVSSSHSQKEKQDDEFGHKDTQRRLLERRISINNDGKELPQSKQSINTYYDILHMLGQGVSSQVFLAQHKKTKEYVAIKVIPKKILINNLDLAREIRILKQINHRYIVKLYDVFLTPEHLQLVMEACEGQELFDEICARRTFTEDDVKDIVLKILDAVGYLHMNNIAHRDLKPENIMFVVQDDGTKNLKIIDFGFASKTDQPNLLDTAAGTLGYIAPEVLRHEPATTQADMWSIGVITYILLVGFPPFLSHADDDDPNMLMNAPFWSLFNERTDMLVEAIKQGNVNWSPGFWDSLKEAKDFVSALLKADPKERMTAAEALRHPWLKSIAKKRESVEDHTPDRSRDHTRANSESQADSQSHETSHDEASSSPTSQRLSNTEISEQKAPEAEETAPSPSDNEPKAAATPSHFGARFTPAKVPSTPTPEPRTMFLNRLRKLQKQATVRAREEHQMPEVKANLEQIFSTTFVPSGNSELDTVAGNAEDAENLKIEQSEDDDAEEETATTSTSASAAPTSRKSSGSTPRASEASPPIPIVADEALAEVKGGPSKPTLSIALPSLDDLKHSLAENDELHEWKKTHFKGPTWCAVCDEFIWGVISKTGYKCKYCKADVHSQCKGKVGLYCEGRKKKPSLSEKEKASGGALSPRRGRKPSLVSPRKLLHSNSAKDEGTKVDPSPPPSPHKKEKEKKDEPKLKPKSSSSAPKPSEKIDKDKDKDKDKPKDKDKDKDKTGKKK